MELVFQSLFKSGLVERLVLFFYLLISSYSTGAQEVNEVSIEFSPIAAAASLGSVQDDHGVIGNSIPLVRSFQMQLNIKTLRSSFVLKREEYQFGYYWKLDPGIKAHTTLGNYLSYRIGYLRNFWASKNDISRWKTQFNAGISAMLFPDFWSNTPIEWDKVSVDKQQNIIFQSSANGKFASPIGLNLEFSFQIKFRFYKSISIFVSPFYSQGLVHIHRYRISNYEDRINEKSGTALVINRDTTAGVYFGLFIPLKLT